MAMRKIRILTSLATTLRTYEKGDVVDWDEADASRLFKAGYAEPVTVEGSATQKEKR